MSTSEADFLGELFRCERFVSLFPTGMPKRACLRRQLDRLVTLDGKGKQHHPREWPPAKPFCAVECQLGRQHLEEARAAGVPAETCLRCGSAQVGSGSAAPCAGCEPDAKEVPRGHLPAPAGPAASSRLWSGEVPDVPIVGLGERQPHAPLLPRQHHPSTPAPRAPVNQEEPVEPVEEEIMAKDQEKKTCRKCGKGLRSDNTRGICGSRCKAPGGAQAGSVKAPKEAKPAKVTPLRPAAPRRAVGRLENPPELTTAPLDELLRQRALAAALISAVDGELRRRQAEIAKALGQAARAAEG